MVFLSDLHNKDYGNDNAKLLEAIRKLNPDVILLGGDIMTAYPGKDFSTAVSMVSRLSDYPMAYAEGNHEYRAGIYPDVYGTMYEDYFNALKDKGVSMLCNKYVDFYDDLRVYCLSIEHKYYRRMHLYPMDNTYIHTLLGEPSEERFNILLAHNPDYFDNYSEWGPELTLSGHVHGGVVRIPGWRGVISPMWKLFPKYDGGMFDKNGKKLIVSRGLGMHTIPLRMFNPAEIVVIDLKPAR